MTDASNQPPEQLPARCRVMMQTAIVATLLLANGAGASAKSYHSDRQRGSSANRQVPAQYRRQAVGQRTLQWGINPRHERQL
jgi:hypothetical protein